MIRGNWPAPRHSWTPQQIAFAARCWQVGMSQSEVAAALAARFGFRVTRASIGTICRVNRDLFSRRRPGREAA